jgi:mannose-6-phosphate isomerase-like protein (cupin superfamily)
VSTEETNGAYAVLEYAAPPNFRGPAPHIHREATETFFGLEGRMTLHAAGQEGGLTPGATVMVPPGTIHRFSNETNQPAKMLVLFAPGAGIENYFTELADLIAQAPTWPPADPTPVIELARRYDTYPPEPAG